MPQPRRRLVARSGCSGSSGPAEAAVVAADPMGQHCGSLSGPADHQRSSLCLMARCAPSTRRGPGRAANRRLQQAAPSKSCASNERRPLRLGDRPAASGGRPFPQHCVELLRAAALTGRPVGCREAGGGGRRQGGAGGSLVEGEGELGAAAVAGVGQIGDDAVARVVERREERFTAALSRPRVSSAGTKRGLAQ